MFFLVLQTPACLATDTSYNIELFCMKQVGSLNFSESTFVVRAQQNQGFQWIIYVITAAKRPPF